MSVFLLDLWHDLREKRLAPVAVALAVALVAVPMVLLKPAAGDGGDAAPAPVTAQAADLPTVQAVDEAPGKGSDLGVFDPKDPFLPRGVKGGGEASGDGVAQLVGGTGSSGTLPGTTVSQTGGGSSDASQSPAGPGSDPYANNPIEKDGSSGTDPVEDDQKPATTTYYTYVIDARFGARGAERKHKGVRRLDILPNADNPLLVFLGVSGDRKKAVFLADSSASQAGEGTCKPNVERCTFIYLSLDEQKDEHFLTDEAGQEYVLKLLDIRRVKVAAKKSAKSSGTDPLFADDARR